MEHATKLIVIVSMAGAIALETFVTARIWPALLPLTIGAFVVVALLSLAYDELCASIVLVFAYLMPALILVLHGKLLLYYGHVWSAALLGAIAPRSLRSGWAAPRQWKVPLMLWALTIAVTWPIVALRELDFTLHNLYVIHLPNSIAGAPPPNSAAGVADNTLALGLGILWFDWLVSAFARREARFRQFIVVGNVVSWAIATAVGIYQLFGNIVFLNVGLYGAAGRASGTMLDANPFGVVAAMWGPALIAAAWLARDRSLRVLAACGLVASWMGLWASAARSAFAMACTTIAFLIRATWSTYARRASPRTRARAAAATAIAAAAFLVILAWLPATTGPLPRLRGMMPTWSAGSLGAFLQELWDRNGYGMVATHLVRAFPLFGVGIGSFHIIVPDYHLQLAKVMLAPDNAQNWFRHQLVENGIVGSVGWILCVVTFGWFVATTRPPAATRFPATIVKGIVISFAVVSLFGIPTQNIAVALAFWAFAFWYVALIGAADHENQQARTRALGAPMWAAIWAVVAAAAAGTAYTARDGLRPPERAATFGLNYFYGFSDAEPALDVSRHSTVWATRHAVAVLAPQTRRVKLTVSVDRLNIAKGPVDVKVSCDNVVVVDTRVSDLRPITRYVALRDGRTRMVVETWVSRSIRPSDYGLQDQRELGLLVDWDFPVAE